MGSGNFAKAVGNGQFIVTAECRPPRAAASDILKACAAALGGSLHAIYAPESEDGVRLGSLAACSHLAAAGADPVLSLLTRDQNRIALQSTILGAASMGVRNIFCTTGRHQTLTSSRTARGVFDVDPLQLLQVANAMRGEGMLADGQQLDSPVDITLGTDANPFADPMELQIMTLEKAVKAGADFVITAPVFNLDRFNIWMSYVRERGISDRAAIIASVMPVLSAQDVIALAERNASLDIPDSITDRLNTAPDKRAAGIHLAVETVEYLRKIQGVHGVHLMTGDNFELAAEILKSSGLSGNRR